MSVRTALLCAAVLILSGCYPRGTYFVSIVDETTGEAVPNALVQPVVYSVGPFPPDGETPRVTGTHGKAQLRRTFAWGCVLEVTAAGYAPCTASLGPMKESPGGRQAQTHDRVCRGTEYARPQPYFEHDTIRISMRRLHHPNISIQLPGDFRGVVHVEPSDVLTGREMRVGGLPPLDVPASGRLSTDQVFTDEPLQPQAKHADGTELPSEFYGDPPPDDAVALRTIYRFNDPKGTRLSMKQPPVIYVVGTAAEADRLALHLFPGWQHEDRPTVRSFNRGRLDAIIRAQARGAGVTP